MYIYRYKCTYRYIYVYMYMHLYMYIYTYHNGQGIVSFREVHLGIVKSPKMPLFVWIPIIITIALKSSKHHELNPPTLSTKYHQLSQVDLPVAFVSRGPGMERLLEALQQGGVASLEFENIPHFATLKTDPSEGS